MELMAWIAMQRIAHAVIANAKDDLTSEDQILLSQLQNNSRAEPDAIALMKRIMTDIVNSPVETWRTQFDSYDIPSLFVSFACIAVTICSSILPPDIYDELVGPIITLTGAVSIVDRYIDIVKRSNVMDSCGEICRVFLAFGFLGTMIKMLVAFIFQEEVVPEMPYEILVKLVHEALPVILESCDAISGYETVDKDLLTSSQYAWPGIKT